MKVEEEEAEGWGEKRHGARRLEGRGEKVEG